MSIRKAGNLKRVPGFILTQEIDLHKERYRKNIYFSSADSFLIQECGVAPESIFIATFTEKAAKGLVT